MGIEPHDLVSPTNRPYTGVTTQFERNLSDIQRSLAQGLRTMGQGPNDSWQQVADALERYANGRPRYADFLRVKTHRADILNNDFVLADSAERVTLIAWVNNLREPTPS
jgi:hypothetical protein